ncbi:hypothetical protein PIB30_032389 [Stylosanthes scabra]|uniref:Uncharacterized protein n=1 Tax=Stylosanthes scabra TaxID=79078 RepID=A0ABU6WFM5_9FABA|nr:hypothetical protein [Stylosanthes scabra]
MMEHKKNQVALKGKEKVRVPLTRVSPRHAALRAPRSPPLKIRTPSSRASPRLAALKDLLPLPSPTSVIMPEKLLVLALETPMTTLPSVATVSKDPIAPILETPQTRKIRRTAKMSVEPIRRRFSESIIAKGGTISSCDYRKNHLDDSSDSEINKEIEDDAKELSAMDEPLVLETKQVPEEEQRFWDYDDLEDWGTTKSADSSKASCTKHPPPDL